VQGLPLKWEVGLIPFFELRDLPVLILAYCLVHNNVIGYQTDWRVCMRASLSCELPLT